MKSISLLSFMLLASCGNIHTRNIYTMPSADKLAGCYAEGRDGEASGFLIKLDATGTYTAYVKNGLNIWAKATGKWTLEKDGVLIGPSDQSAGWHHYMRVIAVETDGPRFHLADGHLRYYLAPGSCGF